MDAEQDLRVHRMTLGKLRPVRGWKQEFTEAELLRFGELRLLLVDAGG